MPAVLDSVGLAGTPIVADIAGLSGTPLVLDIVNLAGTPLVLDIVNIVDTAEYTAWNQADWAVILVYTYFLRLDRTLLNPSDKYSYLFLENSCAVHD